MDKNHSQKWLEHLNKGGAIIPARKPNRYQLRLLISSSVNPTE